MEIGIGIGMGIGMEIEIEIGPGIGVEIGPDLARVAVVLFPVEKFSQVRQPLLQQELLRMLSIGETQTKQPGQTPRP
jgi:hypothetical protein